MLMGKLFILQMKILLYSASVTLDLSFIVNNIVRVKSACYMKLKLSMRKKGGLHNENLLCRILDWP
jgi:hypothetical protein